HGRNLLGAVVLPLPHARIDLANQYPARVQPAQPQRHGRTHGISPPRIRRRSADRDGAVALAVLPPGRSAIALDVFSEVVELMIAGSAVLYLWMKAREYALPAAQAERVASSSS